MEKYTKDDEIAYLKDMLNKAVNTIEFMHECLTNPHYKYTYPDQTFKTIGEIRAIVPKPVSCCHAGPSPGRECAGCDAVLEFHKRRQKRINKVK